MATTAALTHPPHAGIRGQTLREATRRTGRAMLATASVLVLLAAGAHAQSTDEDDDSTPADVDTSAALETEAGTGSVTHLPLPRYVSLKGSEGNARRGPSASHRIDWVFKHAGMPLKLTAEFGNWRRVEDRDGAGGWIHYTLISGGRTVVFDDDKTQLHARPDVKSGVTALADAGGIARLGKCSIDWCRVSAGDADGWVQKTRIWGVDPQEIRD